MRKTNALLFAAGLLALGSCSNETPEAVEQYTPDEAGNIGYMKFDLGDIFESTRADDPEADLNEISNVAFVFKDKDGEVFSSYIGGNYDDGSAYFVDDATHTWGNKCAVVGLPKLPVSVAVVVNAPDDRRFRTSLDGGDKKVNEYSKTPGKNFFMSSSSYWRGNNWTYRTPIDPLSLVKTEDEAKSTTAKANKVCVERYVAKVEMTKDAALTSKVSDGKINPDPERKVEGNDKYRNFADTLQVAFEPMYIALTAKSQYGYTIKRLPSKTDVPQKLQTWSDLNHVDDTDKVYWSNWVDKTNADDVNYTTLNTLKSGSKTFTQDKVTDYAFDNMVPDDMSAQTSVIVCGQYTIRDTKNNKVVVNAGEDFYLVAFEDKYVIYKSEKEAILAMGGVWDDDDPSKCDKLVPNRAETATTDPAKFRDWSNWNGWMRIKDKNIVTRCLKYSDGYGYYSKPLQIAKRGTGDDEETFEGVVRNLQYNVSLKGITGMGIGIPDPDAPIIPLDSPDPNDQTYFLHISIKVLPWRPIDNNVNWE